MRRLLIASIVVVAGMTQAAALCLDGTTSECRVDGKPGTRICIGGHFTPCLASNDGSPPEYGTVTPKYYVLTIVYAPPGSQGSNSSSSVVYGSNSTLGTTTSASSSFKQDYSVTASVKVGSFVDGSLRFSYARTAGSSESLDVKKSNTTTIQDPGPPVDGIDHDRDIIYLWLNPKLDVAITSSSAAWTFADGVAHKHDHAH